MTAHHLRLIRIKGERKSPLSTNCSLKHLIKTTWIFVLIIVKAIKLTDTSSAHQTHKAVIIQIAVPLQNAPFEVVHPRVPLPGGNRNESVSETVEAWESTLLSRKTYIWGCSAWSGLLASGLAAPNFEDEEQSHQQQTSPHFLQLYLWGGDTDCDPVSPCSHQGFELDLLHYTARNRCVKAHDANMLTREYIVGEICLRCDWFVVFNRT